MTVPRLFSCGLSDVGLRRRVNEDCCLADDKYGIFIVADGLGGHAKGDVASQHAVAAYYQARLSRQAPSEAADAANQAVVKIPYDSHAPSERDRRHPGTTLSVLEIAQDKLTVVHAGDSQIWQHDGSSLVSLTTDQRLYGNTISNCLGTSSCTFDIKSHKRASRPTVYCLNSDGLTFHVQPQEVGVMLEKVVAYPSMQELKTVARALVGLALSRGGVDNVTVILVFDSGA